MFVDRPEESMSSCVDIPTGPHTKEHDDATGGHTPDDCDDFSFDFPSGEAHDVVHDRRQESDMSSARPHNLAPTTRSQT